MSFILSAALIACMAGPTIASDAPPAPPPTPPGTAPAPQTPAAPEPKAPAADPEQVKAAQALLDEVAKTYKQAKTISDTIQINIQTPMGADSQEMKVSVGEGDDLRMQFTGMS